MTDHDPTPWDYEPLDRTIYDAEGNTEIAYVERKRNVPILLNAPAMLEALEEVAVQFHAEHCPIAIYGRHGPKGETCSCNCHVGIAKAAIAKVGAS